jgi:hypothetical protein
LAALVVSISITSLLALVIPNVWVRRHHNGLRLFNEFLARHQLGFCTYYAAILVAVEFTGEQNVLRMVIMGLLLLSFPLSLFAAKWASPDQQELLLQHDHLCPPNPPSAPADECKQKVKDSTRWALCQNNLYLLGGSLVVAGLLLPFWLRQKPVEQPMATIVGPEQPPKQVAKNVRIGSVRAGNAAFRDTPTFVHDHIYKLQEERANPVACVVDSEELAAYKRLRWVVFLREDFRSDFAMSVRAAYLLTPGETGASFRELGLHRLSEPPYREMGIEIPESEKGDRIVVVASIYAVSERAKFPKEIEQMLKARVE